MDPNKDLELDQLFERTSASTLRSLDTTIDVEQRLRDLFREAGLDPELVPERRSQTR
ncbi:hypothetical protein NIE79_004719 [Micromonospora sp. NIE79]|uniref:Uncharacterized protein n=1 Tax=Micromonospora trifolii TaxID=2911208 RepID=A0ABS9N863_9ACTN|nr:hypothetical protein [Micromonospora trifolii]MCG5446152.1 hypothetical protein [Micromonospora trifolii]